jgi:hypothetical protein
MKKIKQAPTVADQVYQTRRRNKRNPEYHTFIARVRGVAEKLDKYMRFRAAKEGVGYKLSPEFFQAAMRQGCDTFFGVTTKGDEIIGDEQQPALFKQWMGLKRRH